MSQWRNVRLDWVATEQRKAVDPIALRSDEVVHYSIPALEETGRPQIEPGDEIGSLKTLLVGDEVLISRLNPRKARVVEARKHPRLPMVASGEFVALRTSSDLDRSFLTWLLLSERIRQDLDGETQSVTRSHQRVRPESIRKRWIQLPDVEIQRAIADFLDAETARIDIIIERKRRLLKTLEERRDVLISRALWRQDEFPYITRRLKHLTGPPTSGNRDHSSFTFSEKGIPCLRGLNVRPGRIETRDLLRISQEDHQRHFPTALWPGDLVIVRSGFAGAAAAIPSDFGECNCVDLVVVRRSKSLLPSYLEYVVNSRDAQNQVLVEQSGALLKHFNAVDAGELRIPYRQLRAQEAIVRRLDDAVGGLLNIRERISLQLDLLQEHRQALITAAVTGQLDIPGVAA